MARTGTPISSLGELGDRTISKVKRRVLPLIVLLVLHRVPRPQQCRLRQTHDERGHRASATAYGLGAGIFFIGYAIFEVPSNAGMHRYGARKWIARILVTWGFFATVMALVQGETSFYIIRFLLGAAEAGFFPAMILYLTYWFPAEQRVAVLGMFILAQPLANAIGAPGIGPATEDGRHLGPRRGGSGCTSSRACPQSSWGSSSWSRDRPTEGRHVAGAARSAAGCRTRWMPRTRRRRRRVSHSFMDGLKDPRALIFAALYFGLVMGIYGLSLWLPSIVKAMGNLSTTQVGFIVPIPYLCAALFVFFWSRHSDRTGERVGHATFSMLLGAAGLVASGFLLQASPVWAMVAICVCAMGIFSAISPFWELPSAALAGAAAAAGIALINSLGNLGGFVAPYAVGALVDRTGNAQAGLFLLAGVLLVTAVATFLYGRRTGAGTVPTASHEDVLAKETAAFDLPADELHHRGDPTDVADSRRR